MFQLRSGMLATNGHVLSSRVPKKRMPICDPGYRNICTASRPGQAEHPRRSKKGPLRKIFRLFLGFILLFIGCQHNKTRFEGIREAGGKTFALNEIDAAAGKAILAQLGFHNIVVSAHDPNTLLVRTSVDELSRITAVLALVDSRQEYVVKTLVPVSAARDLPTNRQIAETLGGIAIGTFEEPPRADERPGAIIDIHRESVVAIVPSHFQGRLAALVELGSGAVEAMIDTCKSPPEGSGEATTPTQARTDAYERDERSLPPAATCPGTGTTATPSRTSPEELPAPVVFEESRSLAGEEAMFGKKAVPPSRPARANAGTVPVAALSTSSAHPVDIAIRTTDQGSLAVNRPLVTEITVPSLTTGTARVTPDRAYPGLAIDNGDDRLVLNLPEQVDVSLLLDLAAEYLRLDCIYDPAKIRGQTVTLKLRGRFQGEITIAELYPLLESVLKFRGFAMTRGEGNLVKIVPMDDVLAADPELIGPDGGMIRPGDVVVTRVLELRHMDAASAKNLVENMNLGVAVSLVEERRTLIVTCYAHRLSRIERLLEMIDRPGRPKKVLFRQLQYVTASMLAEKVRAIADELQVAGVTVALASPTRARSLGPPPPFPVQETGSAAGARPPTGGARTVYLDADERTNRILMVGYEEQVSAVAQLVDAFDVPGQELRMCEVYQITHVEAERIREKLKELRFIGRTVPTGKVSAAPPQPKPSPFGEQEPRASLARNLVEEPDIVVLETTNALLVSATREQHAQLAKLIEHMDRVQQDSRVLRTYALMHIEATEARNKLVELQIFGSSTEESPRAGGTAQIGGAAAAVSSPGAVLPPGIQVGVMPALGFGEPQVVIMESTNSLLVNALPQQHTRIETVLSYIDKEMLEDEIPYRVYPLTNSSPSHLAEVLESLVREKTLGDDAKIAKAVRREQEIAIVPDPNTYSLIVYASKKNQDWIASLIKQLDQRRPQVLIDVTLVEITETDAFTYDLRLLRSSPDLDSTAAITGVGVDPGATGRFAQVDGGLFKAFYGDEHVRALLQAMQSKNYGRILAKPKILVNDNERGTIKTADITYVQVTSSVPVSTGGAGTDVTLIQTAVRYEPYEAGITLTITPHISQGEILRLDVKLIRSDFRQGTFADRPPDTTSSELTTSVFVPDGGTIILGGLLKMNQMKGTTKMPILGDIPVLGGVFRSIDNKDTQSKLYVFMKAEIIRPFDTDANGLRDLEIISERDRAAFERHEQEFQRYEQWPGVKGKPTEPRRVLDAR
jgi:type II secretory pathway component GspD/PulD (secretin)